MEYNDTSMLHAKQLMFLLVFIGFIFSIYLIVSTIIIVNTTGILNVTTTPKATISVSRSNSQAKIIGKAGSAGVRLKPGVYQVLAKTSSGEEAAKVITITKKRSTALNLKPTSSPRLRSINDVDFENFDDLLDYGLTVDQINILKRDFFVYKTTSKGIAINLTSVKSGQRTPFTNQPFILTFSTRIDSQNIVAKASHQSIDDMRLQLYSPKDAHLLFDSYDNKKLGVE